MDVQEAEVLEAIRSSEVQFRWDWTEPSVWTRSMLEALENGINGVKETKWFSLMDKVYAEGNLMSAYMRVAKNKGSAGVDFITVERYGSNLLEFLSNLHRELKTGTYSPRDIRRSYISKAGSSEKRPLGIPTVQDRIVQTAVRHVIEPVFENEFADQSYGFRPGRGCKDALREVNRLLKTDYQYVVDADVRKCFDSIPHDALMEQVKKRIADTRVLSLIESFLKQHVLELGGRWKPEEGTPQGAALSPLLCNIYLNPLDHLMEEAGMNMIRYADDMVILCKSKEEAEKGLALLENWLKSNGLELHPDKTRIVDMRIAQEYFDFLGYRFKRSKRGKLNRLASPKSEKNLRAKVGAFTHRCNGHSMAVIIKRCNESLKGWFEYFKQACIWTHLAIDKWIRMRLRSILRMRRKGRGRGRGLDHIRWPNKYFANLGLFSLAAAREEALSLL